MKYFHKGTELSVPDNIYCPREDSELLASVLEKYAISGKPVLDVGCGSGLLSIIMAKQGATVTAIDVSEAAVKTTKTNTEKNSVRVNCFVSDLFDKVNGRFDMIVFNAPYLPVEEGENDPTYAGGTSGRTVIERFIQGVKKYLKPTGRFLLLISSLTGEEKVLSLIKENGMKPRIIAREKVPWEELMVIEAVA